MWYVYIWLFGYNDTSNCVYFTEYPSVYVINVSISVISFYMMSQTHTVHFLSAEVSPALASPSNKERQGQGRGWDWWWAEGGIQSLPSLKHKPFPWALPAPCCSCQHRAHCPLALAHWSPCPSVVPWWPCVTCDRQYIISANYDKIGLILTEEWLDKSAVFVSHHTCFIWHHLHHLLLHTPLPSAETTRWGAQALLFWILFWLIHNQPIFYSGTIYFQWCEMSQKEYHLPIRCQGELRGMTIRMFLDVVRAVGMKCREATEMQPFSVIFAVVL